MQTAGFTVIRTLLEGVATARLVGVAIYCAATEQIKNNLNISIGSPPKSKTEESLRAVFVTTLRKGNKRRKSFCLSIGRMVENWKKIKYRKFVN